MLKEYRGINNLFISALRYTLNIDKSKRTFLITENKQVIGMYTIEDYLKEFNISDELKFEILKRDYQSIDKLEFNLGNKYITMNLITEKLIKEIEEKNYETNTL